MTNTLVHRINGAGRVLFLGAAMFASAAFFSVPNADAYVARRTTVSGPNGGVYRHTTVAGAGGVYHRTSVRAGGVYGGRAGIAALPAGYRPVYVRGVRYYTVGGVYYRPVVNNGRTTFVVSTVR